MIDSTSIAARRFSELHPGYHLVTAQEAAIPYSWLTLDIVAHERKPLPVVDEFAMRLSRQGVDTIPDVAAVLGINEEAVRDAVAARLSDEHLDYLPALLPDGARRIRLTRAGQAAVADAETISPRRIDHLQGFDRLLRVPTSRKHTELLRWSDVRARGMLVLPETRQHDVTTEEVPPRAINRLLTRSDRGAARAALRPVGRAELVEVLAVDAVLRQPLRYLPAVLLVFAADDGPADTRLTVVVDDEVSGNHDHALAEAGGAERMDISVAPPLGEPALPPQLQSRRVSRDVVRGLQRRADTAPLIAQPGAPVDDDSVAARAELSSLDVRCVPAFEHPELLTEAIDTARRRFLLITPSLREAVITDSLLAQLRRMLRRRGLMAHIAYGLGRPDSEQDAKAVDRLATLAAQHHNLVVQRIDSDLPHDLIADDAWVNTRFDWLAFRGAAHRVYRREEGTLISSVDVVDERHRRQVALLGSAAAR
jgi:hypothetical protein